MRLLYFTKYESLGASSRLRSFQFMPFLRRQGVEIDVQALFSNRYVNNLYAEKSNITQIIKSYIKRFLFLFRIKKYDLVIIEKELFPYFPPFFEYLLKLCHIKYIVDYDDPIFHNYDLHRNFFVRKLLGRKIDKVMKMSEHVFCGNDYLEDRAIRAGAKSTSFLPTVIDLGRYLQGNNSVSCKDSDEFIVGWIGTPSTIRYLSDLFPVFDKLSKSHSHLRLHIIGARSSFHQDGYIRYIPWTYDTEVANIRYFDVGIMPLHDTPFEKGKCSYKLIQYMGCAKPVVASPIGFNNQVVANHVSGIFATSGDDWYNAISFFIKNPDIGKKYGERGLERVKEIYNLTVNVEKMLAQFEKILT